MKYLTAADNSLLVIDEIGKMEILSETFTKSIQNLLMSKQNLNILATVPLKSTHPLIEQLKNHKNSKLYHVTKSNRDDIYTEIYKTVKELQI